MDGVQKSGIPGLEDAVRAADKFTAEEHAMFEQDLVKKLVDTKKPEAIATLLRGRPGGGSAIGTGIEETKNIMAIIPPKFHAPIQRQVLLDTMRQATNRVSKVFNERKFAESIGNIGDERGQIIFGKNWNNVKELTSIMERINGPTGLGGGTGAALQNIGAIRGIVDAAYLAPLALVSGGHLQGGAESAVGQLVFMRGLANVLTHPELATKLLTAVQIALRGTPYAITVAVNETGGVKKNIERIKEKVKELQAKPAPTPPPAPNPAPGPQSSFPKDPKDLLAQAEDLQNSFHRAGMAQHPAQPAAPGPQSFLRPTHRFDETSGNIVAIV